MNLNDINYKLYGSAKKGTIVLLHGWGQNIEMMDMLGHPFEDEYKILVLDLPGFGKTPEPERSYSVEDYARLLNSFLKRHRITKPILVGHSFGGRISIKYASMYDTDKVVLLSAPFRPGKKAKPTIRTKIFKIVKKFKCLHKLTDTLRDKWGSEDYRNATPINRGTLIKAVNEDLSPNARKIKCPVFLIYGKKDTAVPVEEAHKLKTLIKDCGLYIFENGTHYTYLEELDKTIAIMKSFFE